MDVDSKDKEHGSMKEKESVLEVEAQVVQARQPLSSKDGENISATPAEEGSQLPFSRARCIALVITVATASFLNACLNSKKCLTNANV
jgi:hypothetical protein